MEVSRTPHLFKICHKVLGGFLQGGAVLSSVHSALRRRGWPTVAAQQQANSMVCSCDTHLLKHTVHHHQDRAIEVVCETV